MVTSDKLKLTLETINTPKGKIPTAAGLHNVLDALVDYFKTELATAIQTLRDTILYQVIEIIKQEVGKLSSTLLENVQSEMNTFRKLLEEQSTTIKTLEATLNEIRTQIGLINLKSNETLAQLTNSIKSIEGSVDALDRKFSKFASKLAETLRALVKLKSTIPP